MIKIIRRYQNSHLVEGFHPLFHESVVGPLFVGVCGCFMGVCGCFWVFVGVRGVTICDYLAQTCPWDHLARRNKKNCCIIKNDLDAATFVNQIFRNFGWNDNVKSSFWIVGTSWMGWGRVEWHWHMGMSYLTSLNTQLLKNIAYVGSLGHYPVQITFTCFYRTHVHMGSDHWVALSVTPRAFWNLVKT